MASRRHEKGTTPSTAGRFGLRPAARRKRHEKGRTAAVLYGSGATIGLLAVALPHWSTLLPSLILYPVAVAYAVTALLVLASRWLTDWLFHLLPIAGAALITVALLGSGNEAGAATFAAMYVFPTVYAASAFRSRQAAAHWVWVGACYAVALLIRPGEAPLVHWTAAMGVCAGMGGMVGWLVRQRDRAEDAMRERESSFRLLFANSPQPMWVYDRDTLEFLEVNDAAVDRYGWTREQFLHMHLTDVRPPEEVPRLQAELRSARPSLQYSGEWKHRHRDGTVVDVEIRSHTIDFRGRRAAVVVADDVTDRKRADALLREAYEREREAAERLRAVDGMKNSILHAVSHELRTPLAIVLGTALTLKHRGEALGGAMTAELVKRLAFNAQRLERLLTGLLDLDRVTRGIVEANRTQTDVTALARRVASECGLRRVRVDVEDGPVLADVDPAKVERIIENLLVNADRHTPDGTPVWVRAAGDGSGVLIVVEDAGPGVPDDLKPFVFDAFRHGGPEHAPGTGIGLSLVAQFAKIHGGRAWVEDRDGGGAAFKVLLPAA